MRRLRTQCLRNASGWGREAEGDDERGGSGVNLFRRLAAACVWGRRKAIPVERVPGESTADVSRRPSKPNETSEPALSEEQSRVLACLRSGLDPMATAETTGLDHARVSQLLRDLVALDMVEGEMPRAVRSLHDPGVPSSAAVEPCAPEDAVEGLPEGVEPWNGEDLPEGTASNHDLVAPGAGPTTVRPDSSVDAATRSSSRPPRTSRPPALSEINYRRVYETRFRELDEAAREDAARHLADAELLALCLDPAPRVVAALLENPRFGPTHARAVALHHKNPRGLEILARRAALLRDSHVQRRLLGNLQLPEGVLERILRTRRLLEVYRVSVDRDYPERTRTRVRSRLRRYFNAADPEERAALVIKTEGRCLPTLAGCTFDGRMTQILCNQSFLSTLFIQNLARFPATPPALIAKLLRSGPARRQPQLRAMLQRHSNASGEWRRGG